MPVLINETMASFPSTGTIKDDAAWNAGGYLKLNNNSSSSHGEFEYTDSGSLGISFTVEYDFKVTPNVGTGADANWFYFGNSVTPHDEDAGNDGYSIAYDDYSGDFATLQIRFNGTQVAFDNSNSVSVLSDGSYHHAKIVVALPNIQVWFDGTKYIDFTDSARVLPGSLYGWGGRAGGSTNEHDIKNLFLQSITSIVNPTIVIGGTPQPIILSDVKMF